MHFERLLLCLENPVLTADIFYLAIPQPCLLYQQVTACDMLHAPAAQMDGVVEGLPPLDHRVLKAQPGF